MPPLAHLLAPQIVQKVNEIERNLNNAGFLAHSQSVGYEKTPFDPRGLIDKPDGKMFDPRTPGGATEEMLGYLQRSGDPRLQNVARSFINGMQGMINSERTAGGHVNPTLLPNAPVIGAAKRGEPVGTTEAGEPIYQAPDKVKPSRTLKFKKGEPAGFDERGESVDVRGRKLGYLKGPAGTFGEGHPMIDLARRQGDNIISKRTGTLANTDAFGAAALQQRYGEHLKTMQDNFNDTGKETFPPGYFDKMSSEQRQDIIDGVRALKLLERGQST